VLWAASGDGFAIPTEVPKMAGTGFLTNMPEPPPLPWSWCDEADVQHYADQFRHSGFFGPVSYYRNLDANYELVKDIGLDTLTMPTYFITGSKDVVAVMDPTGIERMQTSLPNFRGATVIDGAGHWTQQERPAEFNEALLRYLRDLDG